MRVKWRPLFANASAARPANNATLAAIPGHHPHPAPRLFHTQRAGRCILHAVLDAPRTSLATHRANPKPSPRIQLY